jgi:hypothetical protein
MTTTNRMKGVRQTNGARHRAPDGLPEWCQRLMPGKWTMLKTLYVGEVTITPEAAAELLEKHNNKNRPLSPFRHEVIEGRIRAGNWLLTGETVIFDTEGNAQSAQHRLKACVGSGLPIETVAVYGVHPDVMEYIDSGTPKSTGHRLGVAGEAHYFLLAAACKSVIAFLTAGRMTRASGHIVGKFDYGMARKVLEDHPGVREAVSVVAGIKCRKLKPLDGGTLAATLLWALGRPSPAHQAKASLLINSIASLSTPPEWADLNILHQKLADPGLGWDERAVYSAKAFNAHMEGRPVLRLTYAPGKGETFPRLHGWEYDRDGRPVVPAP